VPVAARSKAWVCCHSLPGVAGSNHAGERMSVCGECCVLSEVSATGRSLVQSIPTDYGVSGCDPEVP